MSSAPTPIPFVKKAETWLETNAPIATGYMKAYGQSAEAAYKDPTSIKDPFTTNIRNGDPHFGPAIVDTFKPFLPSFKSPFGSGGSNK